MPARKRSFEVAEGESGDAEPPLLHQIRNMWQFANLCQWIYIFGKAAKIDEALDVEEIEVECLKPSSPVLDDIALALLKLVSSHRGLTHDIFDDQARKQYMSKAPELNPFGDGDEPARFSDFSVLTKIRVLQQLTQWTMVHPERIREKMEEQKDMEQTSWRIEPYGWDAQDRTYFVLDDNRVYRQTEPAPPPPKPKRAKNWRSSRRSSKRRRTTLTTEDHLTDAEGEEHRNTEPQDDGFGGMTWECVAVTLDDVRSLLRGFQKTRDGNEKILRDQLEEHLVPILEKHEESRKRKAQLRERELINLAKMANAKRSSRIASKIEHQKQEEKAREEEQQRRAVEAEERRQEVARLKVEKERDRRLVSREKRLREREARRLRHEEELAQLSEDSKHMANGNSDGRISERRLQAEIERNKKALQDIEDEDEDWVFDCICGLHGQVDDGAHSVACERCNVWQHSKCLGISEETAERADFQFVCSSCTRREQEARNRPRPTIKLKVSHPENLVAPSLDANAAATNHGPSIPTVKPPQASVLASESTADPSPTPSKVPPLVPSQIQPQASPQQHQTNPSVVGAASSLSPTMNAGVSSSHNISHTGAISGMAVEGPGKNAVPTVEKPPDAVPRVTLQGTASGTHTRDVFASPTNGLHSFQGGRAVDSTLSTPNISREIYRAAHMQNGTLPSQAGLSPTKHSPPRPADAGSASKINTATHILPPVALTPSPRQTVLTPPSKSAEQIRPFESRLTGP